MTEYKYTCYYFLGKHGLDKYKVTDKEDNYDTIEYDGKHYNYCEGGEFKTRKVIGDEIAWENTQYPLNGDGSKKFAVFFASDVTKKDLVEQAVRDNIYPKTQRLIMCAFLKLELENKDNKLILNELKLFKKLNINIERDDLENWVKDNY
jgi:hypothetical protein